MQLNRGKRKKNIGENDLHVWYRNFYTVKALEEFKLNEAIICTKRLMQISQILCAELSQIYVETQQNAMSYYYF